jgi:hypothetical protein
VKISHPSPKPEFWLQNQYGRGQGWIGSSNFGGIFFKRRQKKIKKGTSVQTVALGASKLEGPRGILPTSFYGQSTSGRGCKSKDRKFCMDQEKTYFGGKNLESVRSLGWALRGSKIK